MEDNEFMVIGIGELDLEAVARETSKLHDFDGTIYVFVGLSEDESDYVWRIASPLDKLTKDVGDRSKLQ